MAVTIKDVAKQCGMSVSTVSKVFNGYQDISAETREQVMQVAAQIGYHPNALARALKTNRSYNLGVLFVDENVSGLMHPFFAEVLNSFKVEAEARGYDVTFINHNIGTMAMTYVEHCRYRNVDGVCMACVDFYSREVAELAGSDIPCVTIDHVFNNRPSVLSDNIGGISALVDAAYALGHRAVAYLHGQRNSAVTENRILGFYRAMESHGLRIPSGYVVEGRYGDSARTGELVRRLLSRPDRPTCILLPDDDSAPGAYEAVESLGLRVGADVSLAGYDGIRLGRLLRPTLATVQQDSMSMGREAANKLIERVDKPNTSLSNPVVIGVKLIEGASLAAAPANT